MLDLNGACTAGTVTQTFDPQAGGDHLVQFKLAGTQG